MASPPKSETPAHNAASATPAEKSDRGLGFSGFRGFYVKAREYCKNYPANLILALGVSIWAQWAVFGDGAAEVGREEGAGDVLGMVENCSALFFVLLWCTHHRRAKWAVPCIAALLAVASPLRLMTGAALLTAQNADTFFGTDLEEALAFMGSIPLGDFLMPAAGLTLAFFLTLKGAKPFLDDALPAKENKSRTYRRWGWYALTVTPLIFITSPMGYILYGLSSSFEEPPTWKPVGAMTRPASFLESGESDLRVRNYVFVIGETLRADALSLYGFKAKTTPFLDSIPTRRVSRMVSVSMATNSAVPHYLALTNEKGKVEPQNNVLMLARAAGLRTYWLSSQGKQKAVELPISRIAKDADETVYVERHNDFALVAQLERVLDAAKGGSDRFFVIHTYGSHEDPCARIEDFGRPFSLGREEMLDCYAASAMKADELLKRISGAFSSRGESYSIIFTSDHALSIWRESSAGTLRWKRQADMDTQYIVPFVEFGGRVRTKSVLEAEHSILDFPFWFPSWIGVETNLSSLPNVLTRFNTPSASFPQPLLTRFNTPASDRDSALPAGHLENQRGTESSNAKAAASPVLILTLSGRFREFSELQKGPSLNELAGIAEEPDVVLSKE